MAKFEDGEQDRSFGGHTVDPKGNGDAEPVHPLVGVADDASDTTSTTVIDPTGANAFLDFEDLILSSGAESEEEFVIGIANETYNSIKIVERSQTSQLDADFVFNNVSMRVVRNTSDIVIGE